MTTDGRMRQLFRDAFQANPSPDLNLMAWVLLRRAHVRAVMGAIPQPVYGNAPFAPGPGYAVPLTVEAASGMLAEIDCALVEAGALLYQRNPLDSSYYRATGKPAPEGLDLDVWATEEHARIKAAAARVQPNGPGLGGYSVGAMEGWSPADKLADFDDLLADLDRAIVQVAELRDLAARSATPE